MPLAQRAVVHTQAGVPQETKTRNETRRRTRLLPDTHPHTQSRMTWKAPPGGLNQAQRPQHQSGRRVPSRQHAAHPDLPTGAAQPKSRLRKPSKGGVPNQWLQPTIDSCGRRLEAATVDWGCKVDLWAAPQHLEGLERTVEGINSASPQKMRPDEMVMTPEGIPGGPPLPG